MAKGLEREVQALARRIAAAGDKERTRVFHLSWWSERMLEWAMAHGEFKTQLFRFVDVFPACRNNDEVLRHLDEYFAGIDVPRALDFGLDVAPNVPFGTRLTVAVARRNIKRMARQFIAGSSPAEALPQLERLWRAGEACTVDLLGEKTITEADAERYATRVVEMLDALVAGTRRWPDDPHLERDPWGTVPRANVSVKPTALAPLFSPVTAEDGLAQATERLRPVLERAKAANATVHLDMEHDDAKDLTLELLYRLGGQWRDGPQLGCVIQAYRKDSYTDLRTVIDWSASTLRLPLQIRLVKGAYWDYETVVARAEHWPVPVYEDKRQTDANYERCVRLLVERAGSVRPAFASHNLRTIAYAIASARAAGLHDTAIEVQLLYGMAEPIHAALRRLGLRVRVYAPVGQLVPGMAYLVRRLLENTSNESFIRQKFAEGKELEELLTPPGIHDDELPPAEAEPAARSTTDPDHPIPFDNEPHAELRRSRPRARLAAAVDAAPAAFPLAAPVMIGGRAVRTAETIASVDPGAFATVVCRSGRATVADADHAMETAVAAWPEWRATAWRDRACVLFRAARIMRDRRDELSALEVFEAGKPQKEADADVCEAIDFCEYYGREALRLGAGVPLLNVPGETNAYRYQPRGIGVVIAPWNFPLAIPTGMVTAALVAGNCVLFKPAEQTPGIAFRLYEILLAAGLPPGALAFLPGLGEEVGAHLVDHPATAFIAFTGSKAVGLQIIERAGVHHPQQHHVKRVVSEMGGKNAIIVDDDADLDQAVPAIVQSAFSYAGQKCSAASRVIGLSAVFDELVDRIAGATAIMPVGHPRHLRHGIGPLIDEDAWKRVKRYQELAREEGDVVVARNDVPDDGWYAGPTVLVTDDPHAKTVTDEIFGPVLAVMRAPDFDGALALANDTDYALTAGVFSRSPARIRRAADELRGGNIYVNRGITGALVGRQPFGGYGMSGVGSKAGGPDYLLQFLEPRVVTENTIRQGFAPLDE
jgi:RHH-type proline utilization regulon transcriptional repressor/proline dehydrogenase/delta 1-pyrroline-5-carboxylate dehydrogenase